MIEQPRDPPRHRVLTMPEAAQTLRISRSSLRRLFDRKELPRVSIGGRRLVSVRALNAYPDALESVESEAGV